MLCIVGVLGLRAQTDVTSTYITNADFSGTYTQLYTINTDRYVYQPNGWTVDYKNVSTWNMTVVGSTDVMASNFTGTYAVPEDDNKYMVRFRDNQTSEYVDLSQTITIAQTGIYTFSADLIRENGSKINVALYAGENSVTNANPGVWENRSFSVELAANTEIKVGIKFTNLGADGVKAGADNVKITYIPIYRPTAIALNETALALNPTQSSTLSVTYTPADANTDTNITWTTSDPAVATVDAGVVTAVGIGTATITATTANSVSTNCAVTVTEVTPVAAPAFYSEVAAGDFYIVNAATGKAIGTIKDGWGTQAGQADHGIPFTVALGEGVYTLDSHTYNSAAEHFFNGTYVDGGSTNLYITSLGSGKYSISTADGSAFVTANLSDNVIANTAANASSALAQWYFVSKANMESALASATTANPVDATFYIQDPDFSRNHIIGLLQNGQTTVNHGSETYLWKYTTSNYHFKGGVNGNMCAETYRSAGKIYQELTVANGKYLVKCQGFRRVDSGSDETYLYANDEKVALSVFNGNSEGTAASMSGASASFTAGLYSNQVEVYVTDGSLTIGIENVAGNWTCFDNFELYYLGPTVGGEATEIPMATETAMTAGSWYYFDIPVDGLYNLTTTTLPDIVYTNDATVLIENESSVTATFSQAVNETLTAGRYFVKSASAQSLEVSVGAYAYSVGAATLSTADGGYTQSSTFTVTFLAAATSDPAGETTLAASSKATVNGAEVALTAVANGFSLDLGSLTPSTDYAIVIPAGVYGYAGESVNEAISVTLHTPAVFDGEYVLYDATNKLFLCRGANFGTEASMDKYGIPVRLVTDASGVSSFEFKDWTGGFLFSNNAGVAAGIYTDNNSTGWNIIETTGGYILKDANGDVYAKVDNGTLGLYVHTVAGQENANVWTLKTKAERDAIIAAYPTENISNVITASGVATDAASFATFLDANYNATDWTSSVGTAKFTDGIAERRAATVGSWTWTEVRAQNGSNAWDKSPAYGDDWAEVYQATGKYTQTIAASELPAGIYKMTIDGYERHKDGASDNGFGAAGYDYTTSYLAVNGEQVRLKSWYDVHTTALAAGQSGDNYPNSVTEAVTCFTEGYATNEVYIYLDGSTDLTITLSKPNYTPASWLCFNNFTLTRYSQTSANMTIEAGKYGTFVAPFDVTIPSGVTAQKVTGVTNSTLDFEDVTTTIPANTPVVVSSNAEVNQTFYGKDNSAGAETVTAGKLVGIYKAVEIPAGCYVLQTQDNVQAFYKLATAATANTVNRAYLNVGASVKAFFFNDEDADGINAVEATAEDGRAIYNLAGQRVKKAQKGLYIIGGKTVLVK